QLMQVYVQKSTRTTLPRSSAGPRGEEFNQPVPPRNQGGDPRRATGPCADGGARRTGSRPATSGLEDGAHERWFLRKEPDARDHLDVYLREDFAAQALAAGWCATCTTIGRSRRQCCHLAQ